MYNLNIAVRQNGQQYFLYFRSKTSRKVQWFYGKKAYYIAVR